MGKSIEIVVFYAGITFAKSLINKPLYVAQLYKRTLMRTSIRSKSRRLQQPIRYSWLVASLMGSVLFLGSCRQQPEDIAITPAPTTNTVASFDNTVALTWSDMTLRLVRNSPGFTPPVAARAIGYAGVTMYESVVAGMPAKRSMAGQLQGLAALPQADGKQTYNWALTANAAQAQVLKGLFANATAIYKAKIDSLETVLFNQYKVADAAVNDRSVAYGKSIGQAIFDWSTTDGGHEGYSRNFPADYKVPTGPGMWEPTENGRKIPMQPYWGKNRTMIAANASLVMPAILPYSTQVTSSFFAQYLEVYTKNKSLTQEEKEISIWWADDPSETFTPPGHSYNLARIASRTAKADLGTTAEALAKVGIAVNDGFITCWKCKYNYNNIRPYSYVRYHIDPSWVPFWPAPPFPGFVSGHATQSAATATVLSGVFGTTFAFTDDSHVSRVRDTKRNVDFKARSYKSFWESAEESAYSRFLGGIHTRQDNDTGLREGRKIGQNVNALSWNK